MARIAGINIPDNKRVEIGLTSIFGIGQSLSIKILKQASINPNIRIRELTEEQIDQIRSLIEKNYQTEGDLRSEISRNIKRLKETGTYRGDRHAKNLPARGQRTRTNARTKRGKRVTVGSGRKPTAEKT